MKVLLIILILCVVKSYADKSYEQDDYETDPVFMECITELNYDKDAIIETIENNSEEFMPTHEIACIAACFYKKMMKARFIFIINDDLYENLKIAISKVEAMKDGSFNSIVSEARYLLDKCYKNVGKDECELVKCIEFDESPFFDIINILDQKYNYKNPSYYYK